MNATARNQHLLAAIVGTLSLLFGAKALAVDFTWQGSNINTWSEPTNWTPAGGPPNGALDTATIGAGTPNAVAIDMDFTLMKFTLDHTAKLLTATGRTMSSKDGFDIKAGTLNITTSTLSSTDGNVNLSGVNAALHASGNSTITAPAGYSIANKGTVKVLGTASAGAKLTLSGSVDNDNIFEMVSNAAGKETILTVNGDNRDRGIFNQGTVRFLGNTGSIKVQGAMTNNITGKIEVERNATFEGNAEAHHFNNGKVTIDKNTILTFTGKTLENGDGVNKGTFQGRGTLDARQLTSVDPKGIINSGYLKPGGSAGILTIDGDLTQVDPGSLEIEVGGTSIDLLAGESTYDRLVVTGQSLLGGELHVSLIDDFLVQPPSSGDTFDVLTSDGGLSGLFSNASLFVYTTDGLGRFDVSYFGGSGSPGNPGFVRLSNFTAVPEPGSAFGLLSLLAIALLIQRPRGRS